MGYADIDYATRKDELPAITNVSFANDIALYEHWEQSNHLCVMFIKTKIYSSICGLVEHHEKVRDLLKAINEQFEPSDKALASTFIMKFSSTRLTNVRGVHNYIIRMNDIAAQLKGLEYPYNEVFIHKAY